MNRSIRTIILGLSLLASSTMAFAYNALGVSVDTQSHKGHCQLSLNNVAASDVQFAVGGYKYTSVDGVWYGPFDAASPGDGYPIHRKFDAMSVLFHPGKTSADFVVLTGMPQTGTSASEIGYGSRMFGPGDLRLEYGGNTYGIGLRPGGLPWNVGPTYGQPEFELYNADTGKKDSLNARDAGTLGRIELNPQWDHVDHSSLPSGSDQGHAFFVSHSGSLLGNADVSYADTGLSIDGYGIYSYSVSVPYSDLGMSKPGTYSFRASWGPDCGNDMLHGNFTVAQPVPEPSSASVLLMGCSGMVAAFIRRRRNN